MKIVNKYETYKQNYGEMTENKSPSLTNKTRAAQTEIKNIVEQYGMEGLVAKWEASEPFYADMTEAVTVENALELRQMANDYFENLPARARKVFGDNPDLFYEKYKQGDFDGFIKTGVLTEEMADYYTSKLRKRENNGQVEKNNQNTTNNTEASTSINKIDTATSGNS